MTTIVRMEHLRSLEYCAQGVRRFFIEHGLDFANFLKNGIDSEILLAVCNNDIMAVQAVEVAENGR